MRGEHLRKLVEQGREADRTLGLRQPRLGDPPAPGVELTGALREDLPLRTELLRTAKRFGGQVLEGVGGTLQTINELAPSILPVPGMLKRPGQALSAAGRGILEANPPSLSVQAGGAFDPSNPRWWLARGGEGLLQLGSQVALAFAVPPSTPLRLAAFAAPNLIL